MKVVLPKEHGTWLMFFLPALLGLVLSDQFIPLQISFFIGWLLFFLAATPFFNILRNPKRLKTMMPWLIGYMIAGLFLIIPVVWTMPFIIYYGICIIICLIVSFWFIKHKNERNIINDIALILIFCIGGLAIYSIGQPSRLSLAGIKLLVGTFLYFLGCAFYVKSLIRERHNLRFIRKTKAYHFVIILIPLILGWYGVFIAYIPSAIKVWFFPRQWIKIPLHSGIIEIINGMIFFFLYVVLVK